MKILVVHNFYGHYATGGEANVFYNEVDLLKKYGHEVFTYTATNSELKTYGIIKKIKFLLNPGWSSDNYLKFSKVLDEIRPDVVHFHNYKYVLSPSVIKAAKDKGIPTVLTIHNYRMLCPAGHFLRNYKPCELCFEKGSPERLLFHLCSNGKLLDSYLMYRLYVKLRDLRWLQNFVDVYIVLSDFARKKYIKLGIPENRIFVKPNFIKSDIQTSPYPIPFDRYIIYIGRLSYEKGIQLITPTWSNDFPPLVVVGDGPLMNEMKQNASRNVFFTGNLSYKQTMYLLSKSMFLIFPSVLYEGMPLVFVEAMYFSKAILASNIGPRAEFVQHGINGMLYDPYKNGDFEKMVNQMINENVYLEMGKKSHKIYKEKYLESENYYELIKIYDYARSSRL